MKRTATKLAALSSVLLALGVSAEVFDGCAAGSGALDQASGDSGPLTSPEGAADSGWTSGSGADAGVGSSSGLEGGALAESGAGVGAGSGADGSPEASADAGDDASTGDDSSTPNDASRPDDAGAGDAGPVVIFGASCAAGTTYTELFTSDPVASGDFLSLAGSYTYNAATSTLSLGASSQNTQLWIGPRPSWTNYTVAVPARIDSTGGNGGITFRMQSTPAAPANNAGDMYYAGISTTQAILGIENGDWDELVGPSATFAVGTFYTLEVIASGTSLSMSVSGTSYATNLSDGTFTFGSLGLRTYASGMTYGPITVTCN